MRLTAYKKFICKRYLDLKEPITIEEYYAQYCKNNISVEDLKIWLAAYSNKFKISPKTENNSKLSTSSKRDQKTRFLVSRKVINHEVILTPFKSAKRFMKQEKAEKIIDETILEFADFIEFKSLYEDTTVSQVEKRMRKRIGKMYGTLAKEAIKDYVASCRVNDGVTKNFQSLKDEEESTLFEINPNDLSSIIMHNTGESIDTFIAMEGINE